MSSHETMPCPSEAGLQTELEAPASSEEPNIKEEEIIPLREIVRRAIIHALKVKNGSVGRAARALGIGRATLYRRVKKFGLSHMLSGS